jgi:hypothetical protein
MAARPEPMANVMDMMELTLIPINVAAPLSSEHALIALPVFVLLIKRVNATMTTMHVTIVMIVRTETESGPRLIEPLPKTAGKTFVDEDQSS